MVTSTYVCEDNELEIRHDDYNHVIGGKIEFEEFRNKTGKLHRLDGPAVIDYRREYRPYYNYNRRPLKRENNHRDGRGYHPRMEWWSNGKLHREDGPAIIIFEKEIGKRKYIEEWYFNDEIQNADGGPTCIEYEDGKWERKSWKNRANNLHREDGPAVITRDGFKEWYIDGKLHREDGPAITGPHGHKEWYHMGKLHREDGPAVVTSTELIWYRDGKRHRTDGPATIAYAKDQAEFTWYYDGNEHRAWDKPSTLRFSNISRRQWNKINDMEDVIRLGGEVECARYMVHGILGRKDYTKPVVIDGRFIGTENEVISYAKWEKDGILHREDGPANIGYDSTAWYFEGKLHRLSGPAITREYPSQNEYYIHGKRIYMKNARSWLQKNKVDLSTEEGQLAFYMMYGFDNE